MDAGPLPVPASRYRLALAGTLALLALLHLPLFRTSPIDSSDHVDHYLRVEQYAQEIRAGHWPQLLPDPVRGGGHAFPRYYPPLVHMGGAATVLLVGDGVVATHLMATLVLLLAAAALFALLRAAGARPSASALGAIAYGTMPYHDILLYIRGAFAEAAMFLWYPLLLLGLWKGVSEGRLPRWWPLVLAATVLTHTALTLWAILFLAGLALLGLGWTRVRGCIKPVALSGLLAAGVAALYLVPMLNGLGRVRAGDPEIMWSTAEHLGTTLDRLARPGLLVSLEALLATAAVVALWKLRRSRDLRRRLLAAAIFCQALVVGMIVAPLEVWNLVPQPLLYVQFPWRLAGLVVFLLSLAIGLATARFASPTGKAVVLASIALFTLAAIPRTLLATRDLPTLDRAFYRSLLASPYADAGLTQRGDYLPRGQEPRALAEAVERTRDSLRASSGPGGWQRQSSGASVDLTLTEFTEVRLPLVGYPELYRVRDRRSGAEIPALVREGQLAIRLGPGQHLLEVRRRLPQDSAAGLALALVALVATLVLPGALWGCGVGDGRVGHPGGAAASGDAPTRSSELSRP